MLALPFLFVGFVFRFPAGLIMYWITTNVWTIGQQQFLRRVVGTRMAATAPPLPDLPPGRAGASGADAGGGGFLARLQQSATQAQDRKAAGAQRRAARNGARAEAEAGTGGGDTDTRVTKAPPPPPRGKKKKRSGRRR